MLWSSLSSLLPLVSCSSTNPYALNKIQQENSYMYICIKGKTKQKEKELILKKDVELPSL